MIQNNDAAKFQYRLSGWRQSVTVRFFLFLALAVMIYLALSGDLVPQTYNIKQGAVSEITIVAPEPMEDAAATQKAKEDAVQKVQPVYTFASLRHDMLIEQLFEKLMKINGDDQVSFEDKVNIYKTALPDIKNKFLEQYLSAGAQNGSISAPLQEEMKKRFGEQEYSISEEAFFKFPKLTQDELAEMLPVTKDIVVKLMNDQIVNAQAPRAKVAELVSTSKLTQKMSRELVQELARMAISPNKFYDQAATDEAKTAARENTKPVVIKKGDAIVRQGEVITADIYDRLEKSNLLKSKGSTLPQLGLAIMIAMLVFVLYLFIRNNDPVMLNNNAKLLMLVLILCCNIIVMKIVSLGLSSEYPNIGYVAPVSMGSMLIAILLNTQLAFFASVFFSLLAGIFYKVDPDILFDFHYGFVAAVICFVAVFTIHRASQRSTILKSGIMVSLFAALAVASLSLLDGSISEKSGLFSGDTLYSLGFAIAGGLLTAVLVIGLMPFFEVSFGILSSLKLIELSSPNHPLLRKLLTETPGTYHHSVMVGNLAETAAESIGANGLLCRVGSFYHDIGKTKRPSYFIENQTNIENPHDHIEPSLSKSIIIAHARDGVEMLKEHKIPKQIRDIAEQHHGTTLLAYFYHKARKRLEEDGQDPAQISEKEYRYPGPKAQSKEAAIVGIADCVEAAVRSLRNPTIEQIDGMIHKIIKNRLDDSQFNECDLTLKELETVAKSLKETLLGIFHSRIEYPSEEPKKNKEGA